ncbi:hypothetical protein J4221_00940 [Candidatus Pacearchaeota archaeon]|nr:hypothetical protein [Candidatus Pacearchaeota archaeon]
MTKLNIINELREYIESNYKDPVKAVRVLMEYTENFIPSRWEEMKRIVFRASDSTRLDVLLDQAITQKEFWRTVDSFGTDI